MFTGVLTVDYIRGRVLKRGILSDSRALIKVPLWRPSKNSATKDSAIALAIFKIPSNSCTGSGYNSDMLKIATAGDFDRSDLKLLPKL